MWDPADEPARGRRPPEDFRLAEPGVEEPWVDETGPRAPSRSARAVVLIVVAVTILVSFVLACALLVQVLSLTNPFPTE